MATSEQRPVGIGAVELRSKGISAPELIAVARHDARVSVSEDARAAMERSASVVAELAGSPEPAYGVTTGFGSLAIVAIPVGRREELQRALIRSHAAGMGAAIEREVVRAMMLLRARTLAMGWSGTRPVVAQTIVALLNAGLTPVVPEHGSLGASGDLAPLAHCALALMGEGDVGGVVRGRCRADHPRPQGGPGADQRHRRDAGDARAGDRGSGAAAAGRGHRRGDVGRGAARNRPRVRGRTDCTAPPAGTGGERRQPPGTARRLGDRRQPPGGRPPGPGRLLASVRAAGGGGRSRHARVCRAGRGC